MSIIEPEPNSDSTIDIVDTITARAEILPENREDWAAAAIDIFESQPGVLALEIMGQPVMQSWELPYMKRLAKIATSNGGNILELGGGLYYSSKYIQEEEAVTKHDIIEANKIIAEMGRRLFADHDKVNIIESFWEDAIPDLKKGTYNGIFFDTYPLEKEQIHKNHFWFFDYAYKLLAPGGVLTYYSDETDGFSDEHIEKLLEAGFREVDISYEVMDIKTPKDNGYWPYTKFMIPTVRKPLNRSSRLILSSALEIR